MHLRRRAISSSYIFVLTNRLEYCINAALKLEFLKILFNGFFVLAFKFSKLFIHHLKLCLIFFRQFLKFRKRMTYCNSQTFLYNFPLTILVFDMMS